MLGRDLALAFDPVQLFELPGRRADDWQARILRSCSKRQLLCCARQTGKSETVAAAALHEALYVPPALVLLVSPSLRQGGELFRKILDLYRVVAQNAPAEDESSLRLELRNGSRIISLPGSEETVRGFSGVRLVIFDEAARVQDALYAAVRPMLAVSNGRLIALTTPWGRRGWFFYEWTSGGLGWERTRVKAADCPRITREFLAEERRSIGELFYRSEYGCEFVDNETQVFASEDIERMVNPAIRPLFPGLIPPLGVSGDEFFDADIRPLKEE